MTLQNHRSTSSDHNGSDVPHRTRMNHLKSTAPILLILILLLTMLTACDVERRKSDAELGLNPQQVAGRKLFDNDCDRCHRPYSTKGKKVPD